MCRPRAFAACGCCGRGGLGGVVDEADVRRTGGPKGQQLKSQGERSEALGERIIF